MHLQIYKFHYISHIGADTRSYSGMELIFVYFISARKRRFKGPTWCPPGSCRPQMGPMLAPWTFRSGILSLVPCFQDWNHASVGMVVYVLIHASPLSATVSQGTMEHSVNNVNIILLNIPDGKVHGANMGPTWGRQVPGRPHVGHVNLAIWDSIYQSCAL